MPLTVLARLVPCPHCLLETGKSPFKKKETIFYDVVINFLDGTWSPWLEFQRDSLAFHRCCSVCTSVCPEVLHRVEVVSNVGSFRFAFTSGRWSEDWLLLARDLRMQNQIRKTIPILYVQPLFVRIGPTSPFAILSAIHSQNYLSREWSKGRG